MHDNFTVIGNGKHGLLFIGWTFLIATYFLYNSSKLFLKYCFTKSYLKPLSIYIYLACISTPLVPYTQSNVFLDDLHVFLAFSSSALFLGVWLAFLWHLKTCQPSLCAKLEMPFILLVQTLMLFLLYFGCINSIIEVTLVIAMILLIEFLKKS